MLALGWPAVYARFLGRPCVRPGIGSRPIVFRPLIPFRAATMHRRPGTLFGHALGLSIRLPVSRRGTNLELIQLVPLFIGAIPFRDGVKFANPAARINRFRIIHVAIMNHTSSLIQLSRKIKLKTADKASPQPL